MSKPKTLSPGDLVWFMRSSYARGVAGHKTGRVIEVDGPIVQVRVGAGAPIFTMRNCIRKRR